MSDKSASKKIRNFVMEVGIILGAVAIGIMVRNGLYETMIVTSGSMQPTLQINSRYLVDHREYLHGHWRRGDIVTFKTPKSWGGDDDTLVKRVIGLPGESIEIRAGAVYINGQPLDEPYLAETPDRDSIGPVNLGSTQYFVAGDNRNHSDDSRVNGPIQDADIRGRVVLGLWPLGRLPRVPYAS